MTTDRCDGEPSHLQIAHAHGSLMLTHQGCRVDMCVTIAVYDRSSVNRPVLIGLPTMGCALELDVGAAVELRDAITRAIDQVLATSVGKTS